MRNSENRVTHKKRIDSVSKSLQPFHLITNKCTPRNKETRVYAFYISVLLDGEIYLFGLKKIVAFVVYHIFYENTTKKD